MRDEFQTVTTPLLYKNNSPFLDSIFLMQCSVQADLPERQAIKEGIRRITACKGGSVKHLPSSDFEVEQNKESELRRNVLVLRCYAPEFDILHHLLLSPPT